MIAGIAIFLFAVTAWRFSCDYRKGFFSVDGEMED
jgi:hypothetical protein